MQQSRKLMNVAGSLNSAARPASITANSRTVSRFGTAKSYTTTHTGMVYASFILKSMLELSYVGDPLLEMCVRIELHGTPLEKQGTRHFERRPAAVRACSWDGRNGSCRLAAGVVRSRPLAVEKRPRAAGRKYYLI